MTSINLFNPCFKICSWIPLTKIKSLRLNSTNAHASSIINKFLLPLQFAGYAYKFCGFHLYLRIPFTFCGIHLQLQNPEQPAIFACCRIRSKLNVPTKFTLQVFVRGIHVNLLSGILLHIGTCLITCLWSPATCRHKVVRLSSAQFGLVMNHF